MLAPTKHKVYPASEQKANLQCDMNREVIFVFGHKYDMEYK